MDIFVQAATLVFCRSFLGRVKEVNPSRDSVDWRLPKSQARIWLVYISILSGYLLRHADILKMNPDSESPNFFAKILPKIVST